MNKAVLMGRLTRDVDARHNGDKTIARYTLAVDRRKQEGADFIPCVAFNKSADFAEKYFKKGTKIVVTGSIRTGSYVNKDGVKVYTTEVYVDDQEFAEGKKEEPEVKNEPEPKQETLDDFLNQFSETDEELPFN